uniref:Basement membrane-specific heparan sulfate proteoglycan core protein n=1 Tax=Clastoptera arizonana TaxID=38151 RepID=A0A1B6EDX6_9HEMI
MVSLTVALATVCLALPLVTAGCGVDEFQCNDGTCIPNFEKCNQINECNNGEDELNCPCRSDQYQCRDGTCILQRLYCNGVKDCLDNSDEDYCLGQTNQTLECGTEQFKCKDGSCILRNLSCNGQADCPDKSDEENCFRNKTACRNDQWQCDDGTCLDLSVRCNQRVDCVRDRSDEMDCPQKTNHVQCMASEFQCRNGVCIDAHRKCDRNFDCPDNSDEQSCPCTENDFKCGNGYCIPMAKRCDGIHDCQDKSDEQFCKIKCQPDEFKCRNGECILKNNVCNHVRHCSDGSDEDNCALCRSDQFHCPEGRCLPINSVCNGHQECQGGEDERNCGNINPVTCRQTEFTCNDRTCIHLSKRCDGIANCPDQSDEEPSICDLGLAPCPSSDFTCSDGSCISRDKQCNGKADCPHGGDELGCSSNGNTNNTLQCIGEEFHCKDGKKCIQKRFRCDQVKDCDDTSDEENCSYVDETCSPLEFTCNDGTCIPHYLKCNSIPECPDDSDESNCEVKTCSPFEISCGDGTCVSKSLQCDGRRDCYDGQDEENCGCRPDQFQCRDNRCIFASQRCDRRPDCRDRSDEENCRYQCTHLEFKCHSGDCIPITQHCDRNYQCPDGSDEVNCYSQPKPTNPPSQVRCDSNQFACHSGNQCVPQYAHCDQNRDCDDASDEYNCAGTSDLLILKTYPPDQIIKESREVVFQCRDEGPLRANIRWVRGNGQPLPPGSRDLRGRLEIPNIKLEHSGKYICEAVGYPESTPGSRVSVELVVEPFEQSTIRPPKACEYYEATCTNGDCIPKSAVCNDHYDCTDGSDEFRCNRHGCEPNQFRCDNSKCVQKTWRCDSDDDCGDGSDENNCGTSPPGSMCQYNEFACSSGDQCIPKAFHCDTEVDCMDRSDEQGCSKVTIQTPPPPMVKLNPGETFTITCRAVGVPSPEVVWRLNWGHIPEKCTSTSINGFGTLNCPNIQESDQGAYSCEAINNRGSVFAIPDTILVVKRPDDVCPRGQFNELAKQPQDCISCFCFGVTTECNSANLFTYQLPPPLQSYRIVNVYVSPSGSVEIRPDDSQYQPNVRPLGQGFQILTTNNNLNSYDQTTHSYFALPENHYGNQLKSYGGYLKYTVNFVGSGALLDIPDVILTGNGYTLIYKGYPLSQGTYNNVAVQLFPQNWYKVTSSSRSGSGIPLGNRGIEHATREDMMMALEDVDNILIRTQYLTNGMETTLTDINMDSAGHRNSGQGKAAFVEECICPPGYSGLSCEKCAPGYIHQDSGSWLGRCFSGNVSCPSGTYGDPRRGIPCEPCPCPSTSPSNRFASTCSLGSDGSVTCDCQTGYQGRRCESCARGYTGNPLIPGDLCRKSVGICDPAGSVSTEPDASGRCICKIFATGQTCNQCKPNTFNLASSNEFGCVECFCMGIPNTTCSSSNLYRSQISAAFTRTTQDFQLVRSERLNQPFSDDLEVDTSARELVYRRFTPEVYYWVLPARFLHNKVTSYGGNLQYTLRYVPTPGGQSSRNNAPDVVIASTNGVELSYFHNEKIEPNSPVTVTVPLLEQNWSMKNGAQTNRQHLMMALAELKNIYIKATYTTNTQSAALISVSLDITEDRNTGQSRAVEVEQCFCPQGHRGTSCEECEAGYTKQEEGFYLNFCEPCNCNGHSTQCDPTSGICLNCGDNTEGDQCEKCQPGFEGDPLSGGRCTPSQDSCNCDYRGSLYTQCRNNQCTCKTNVEGPRCDRCREGTFDLSEDHIEGCLECICSGVSRDCQSSNLYRDQIPMQIIDRSHTFTLTDINRQTIIQDDFILNVAMNEIGYDFSNQRQRLFWSLPEVFTGNKITSYGGNLTFTQHYTSLPNVSPSYDTDVVIIGSGITLYWTSDVVLHPNENRTLSIPLVERFWRRKDTQRAASRADLLNALSDIDAILIRATHSTHTIHSYLSDVSLDTTVSFRHGQSSVATSVEVCRCPEGYKGTSCESCSSGYYKGNDLTCKRCPCNNNEDYCDIGPNSEVVCYCKQTYEGPTCANHVNGNSEPTYPPRQPSQPTITVSLVEPTIRIVEAGNEVKYTCSGRSLISSRDPITIKWSKEGGPLPDRAIDDSHGILIITNIRVSDSGTYICSVSDGYSLVQERAQLTVGGGQDTPPRVNIEPPYLQVREGQPVELRCLTTGVPTPNLIWEKDGRGSLNPQYTFSNGVFRIPYVRKEDEGHYRCIATNPFGTSDASVTLQVFDSPQYPPTSGPEPTIALTVEPRDYSGRPGDTVQLRCSSNNNRNVRYRWIRLHQTPLPSTSVAGDDGILTIYNASPNDSGVYVCIAVSTTTGAEESEVQARINIVGESPSPVSTIIEPDRQTVAQGLNAELLCKPSTQGTVTWSKAGESYLPSHIQVNGPILRITNIKVEDRGVYICHVQGSEGSSRSSAIVEVERREPPEITLYPKDREIVIEGGSALIQCRATGGIPTPTLQWSRPDNKQLPTRNIEILPDGVLRFNSVTRDEEGQYMCTAENVVGSRTAVATLEVQSYPIISIYPPSPVTVSPGQRVKLECRASGHPQPSVSWSRHQTGASFFNMQEITAKSLNLAVYEIPSVTEDDDGSYTCVAENSAGPVEERIQLIVSRDSGPRRGDIPGDVNPYDRTPSGIKVDDAYTAPLNGSIEMHCAVHGLNDRNIRLQWVRQDRTPLSQRHISHDGVLHIDHLQFSDAGTYVCQCLDQNGSLYFQATTNLRVTPGLKIKLEPTRQVVKPGDNAQILCTATGEEPIEITWLAIGRDLPNSVVTRGGQILFRNIKLSDAGRYMCRARDARGQIAESNSDVIVNEHNYVKAVDRHPVSYEGSSVRLQCDTDTHTQIIWTRDSEPLPRNSFIQGSVLILDNLKLEDGGRYICQTDTSTGTASDYIELRVEPSGCGMKEFRCGNGECIELDLVCDGQPHCQDRSDETICGARQGRGLDSEPMELGIEPSKDIVNFGDSVDVRCFDKRSSNTKVYWSKVQSSMAFNERTSGDMLRIDNANTENSGVFRCTAQSQNGHVVEKDYVLNVEGNIPINNEVQQFSVNYGDIIPLECQTDLEPPVTYTWTKQGSVLPSHSTANGILLNISSVTYEDAGLYICSANNSNVRMEIPRLLLVRGAVPHFSQAPSSYLSLPTLPNAYLSIDIEISFKPKQPDGLILYNAQYLGANGDFISFGIRNGYPEFRFDLGSGTAVISGNAPLTMDEWHTIKLSRSKKQGLMYVDGQGPFKGDAPKRHQGLDLSQPLFVGGVPDFSNIHKLNGFDSGFVGCISRLVIGKAEQDLIKDALVKNGITSCETCAINPCSNNGACQEAPTTQGFICICPRGFSGNTCNKFGEPCSPGVCGKGRCLDGEDGIECYCPLGKGGNRCAQDVSVSVPQFSSKGYLAYSTPKSQLKSRFTLKFKANDTSDGILLYSAQNGEGHGDFVSLAIKNRRLEFRFDTGSGVVELKNVRDIPIGKWITVYAERSLREARLAVSGELAVSKTLPGVSKGLDLNTELYIGGYDKEKIQVAHAVGVNSGFFGCISEIDVSGSSLTLSSVIDAANVGECLDSQGLIGDPCKYMPCHHDGVCYPIDNGRTFECRCTIGYSGTLCEISGDVCAARPCQNSGTCIPTSSSYKCNCPSKYTGKNCEYTSEFTTQASFQGDGFVELSSEYLPHTTPDDEETIVVEFTTSYPDGLIFWHGQTPDIDGKGQDYLSLAVVDGYLELSYELGSNPANIIISEQRVDDGRKHNVTVKRKARDGTLEMDSNIPIAFGESPGTLIQLNTKGNIYIGGLPNIELMTGRRYLQSFYGCIHSLKIQESGTINFGESAISTVNVQPCSSTNDDYETIN